MCRKMCVQQVSVCTEERQQSTTTFVRHIHWHPRGGSPPLPPSRGTLARRSPPEHTHPQSGTKASSCFLSSMLFRGFSRSWIFRPTCQRACHSPKSALIQASCSASFSTPRFWLSASMTHLGSTFTTCTQLFDKGFDG